MTRHNPEHNFSLSRADRENLLGQKAAVIWFTGLSGSGKSTIANELAKLLTEEGKLVYILDGDSLRNGLNKDLGFSLEDRNENLRRAAEVAKILADLGTIVLCSFITPLEEHRGMIRQILGDELLKFCYVKCSLEKCEERDPKGLYSRARSGEIQHFTGVSSPFEEAQTAEIIVNTEDSDPASCAQDIIHTLVASK